MKLDLVLKCYVILALVLLCGCIRNEDNKPSCQIYTEDDDDDSGVNSFLELKNQDSEEYSSDPVSLDDKDDPNVKKAPALFSDLENFDKEKFENIIKKDLSVEKPILNYEDEKN
jgi:hypothetical protein